MSKKFSKNSYQEYEDFDYKNDYKQKERFRQRRLNKKMKAALKNKDLHMYIKLQEDY